MFKEIYYNLCESKKQCKSIWKPKSNIHRHHIIPIHAGGLNEESNFTYLSIREHIIAHFLLWKIYNNTNDLRAMYMLGAKLSYQKRKLIGEWCRDNKIGFHNSKFSKKDRALWSKKGLETQKQNNDKNSFWWWSTKEGQKYRASLGGKKGSKTQIENKIGIHNPDNFSKNASLGGKSIKGMVCVTNGKHRTRIKPNLLENYLSKGYKKGFTLFS
jgi:hypothetical protein